MTIEDAKVIHPLNSFRPIQRSGILLNCRVIGYAQQGGTPVVMLLMPIDQKYGGVTLNRRHKIASKYQGKKGTLEIALQLSERYNTFYNNLPTDCPKSK